jgi:dTDP-4-amino-4,6-dideoxygalactose transaminase
MDTVKTIPFGKPLIDEAERNAVMEVLCGTTLVHGPKAKKFEEAFGGFTGAPQAVSVSSCTAGMHLFYFAMKLGPGDEVIVPAQTHAATAHAVELCGAKSVFVDAEARTGNIDLDQLEAVVTERTKAIVVVHYLGLPVDMVRVRAIADKRGLKVLEDCALAVGTYLDGVHAGLHGDAGSFSFYPVKHLTTAEGGMLITRDEELAAHFKLERAFGVDRTPGERSIPGVYDVVSLGFNYRMNEIEAAIGIEQLKKITYILAKREENYMALRKGLQEINEITLLETTGGRFKSSYYCMSAILNDKSAAKRYEIIHSLKRSGVGTSVYYPKPVPLMRYYKEMYGHTEASYPIATRISFNSIALPVGPHLDTEDMAYIVDSLKKAIQEA